MSQTGVINGSCSLGEGRHSTKNGANGYRNLCCGFSIVAGSCLIFGANWSDAADPLGLCLSFECASDFISPSVSEASPPFRQTTEQSRDGSCCLAVALPKPGDSLIAHFSLSSFDLAVSSTLSFDYKLVAQTDVAFQLRLAERDYRIGVSGAECAMAGSFTNVCAIPNAEVMIGDGTWHTMIIDARSLLRQYTRCTIVDQLSVVVSGVSEPVGQPPGVVKGDALYLDNVRIGGSPRGKARGLTVIDDFEAPNKHRAGFFGSPNCKGTKLDTVVVQGDSQGTTAMKNRALSFHYDVTEAGAYAGFWHQLPVQDLSDFGTVRCRLRCEGSFPQLEASVLWQDNSLGKCFVAPFASKPDAGGWRQVAIPIGALEARIGLSRAKNLSFSVAHEHGCSKGAFLIDDIRLDPQSSYSVADFECAGSWNRMISGGCGTLGPTAVSDLVVPDETDLSKESNRVCRISFGGSIGAPIRDSGEKARCYWDCPLYGVDGRTFRKLVFRIRGSKGGESVCLYLVDGGRATRIAPEGGLALTTDWQELRIGLADCASRGSDVSLLKGLRFSFEGDGQTGTVLVDDLRFEGTMLAKKPTAGKGG